MRTLGLAAFVCPFMLIGASVLACGDTESSSPSATPDSGPLPDRTVPGDPDTSVPVADTGVPDTGSDAGVDATPTCPIAEDATVTGNIEMSVDDNFKLYVNGALVHTFTGTWNNVQNVSVTLNRNPTKKNVIAIEAINAAEISGLDRMAIAELTYTVGATEHKVVTDATWKHGPLANGWEALDYAEPGWAAATVEGDHGVSPYGSILGTSDAKFIWSYDSAAVDTATKPDTETVYLRKTLYVSQAGAPQATPGTCN